MLHLTNVFLSMPLHNNKHIDAGFVETLEGGLALQSALVCMDMPF